MLLEYAFGSHKCWSPKIDFLEQLQRVTDVTNECHIRDTFLSMKGQVLASITTVTEGVMVSQPWHFFVSLLFSFSLVTAVTLGHHDCDTFCRQFASISLSFHELVQSFSILHHFLIISNSFPHVISSYNHYKHYKNFTTKTWFIGWKYKNPCLN